MIYKESAITRENVLDLLNRLPKINKIYTQSSPNTVPLIESITNTGEKTYIVKLNDIIKITEDFDITYREALDSILYENHLSSSDLTVAIDEYLYIDNPDIVNIFDENVVLIKEQGPGSLSYNFCETCMNLYAETGDQNWIDYFFETGPIEARYFLEELNILNEVQVITTGPVSSNMQAAINNTINKANSAQQPQQQETYEQKAAREKMERIKKRNEEYEAQNRAREAAQKAQQQTSATNNWGASDTETPADSDWSQILNKPRSKEEIHAAVAAHRNAKYNSPEERKAAILAKKQQHDQKKAIGKIDYKMQNGETPQSYAERITKSLQNITSGGNDNQQSWLARGWASLKNFFGI